MKVSVWDTYVQRHDDKVMHFDIIVASDLMDEKIVFGFGQEYLKAKQIQSAGITTKECRFCHIEQATDQMIAQIEQQGYYILEMENCN